MLKKTGVDGVKKNLNADVSCVLDILWVKFLLCGGHCDKGRTAQNKLCKSMEEFKAMACFYASIVFLYEDSQLDTRIYAKLFIFFENILIFCVMLSMQRTVSTHAYAQQQQTGQRDPLPGPGLRAPGFSAEDSRFEGQRREEWELEMGM